MSNINQENIKDLFSRINVWKRGDEHAPHKPLLLSSIGSNLGYIIK